MRAMVIHVSDVWWWIDIDDSIYQHITIQWLLNDEIEQV